MKAGERGIGCPVSPEPWKPVRLRHSRVSALRSSLIWLKPPSIVGDKHRSHSGHHFNLVKLCKVEALMMMLSAHHTVGAQSLRGPRNQHPERMSFYSTSEYIMCHKPIIGYWSNAAKGPTT